jgi:DNA polymerase
MNKVQRLNELFDSCSKVFLDYFNGDSNRAKVVIGGGNSDAKIMFIGEAPGEQEILQGKPFVGAAGKNFEKFLESLGLSRDDVYVSNVVKIRPTKINPVTQRKNNRPPNNKEIELSREYLDEEIKLINPNLIVTLGNVPLKRITGYEGITNYHGKILDSLYGIKVFSLFHPATLIYNHDPKFKDEFNTDLDTLKQYIAKIR